MASFTKTLEKNKGRKPRVQSNTSARPKARHCMATAIYERKGASLQCKPTGPAPFSDAKNSPVFGSKLSFRWGNCQGNTKKTKCFVEHHGQVPFTICPSLIHFWSEYIVSSARNFQGTQKTSCFCGTPWPGPFNPKSSGSARFHIKVPLLKVQVPQGFT